MKIETVYRIGSEIFATHAEVHAAMPKVKAKTLREEIYEVFIDNIDWTGFTGDKNDIMMGVDAVFDKFNITGKKRTKGTPA